MDTETIVIPSNHDRERTPIARISAILFDLDNTLISTRKSDVITTQKVAEKISREYEIPLPVAKQASETFLRRFRRCVENPMMTLEEWRILLWVNALGEEYDDLAEDIYVIWKRYRYRNLTPPESTLKILRSLRKQYQLALVTNGPSNSQWEKIKELGLEDYFDAIVVSGDLQYEKPEPEIFHRVCDNLGVRSFECLIVGDRIETDIKGGYAAELGITVWLPLDEPGQLPPDPLPDYTIRDISELQYILGRPRKNDSSKSKRLSKPNKGRTSTPPGPNAPGTSASVSDETSSEAAPESFPASGAVSETED